MEKNSWKTLAIVFIILCALETLGWIYAVHLGNEILIAEENGKNNILGNSMCQSDICMGYDTYYYNADAEMCYCYVNGNMIYNEYLGG